MDKEEFNTLMNRKNEEVVNCLVKLTKEDQITVLLLVMKELGGLPSVKELLEICCDERKGGDRKEILSAVTEVLEVHKKHRNLRLDLL